MPQRRPTSIRSVVLARSAQPIRNRCRLLLVIDDRPLRAAAWTNLQRERKRLEKATRDLHRHEEIDEPEFRTWLGATFPELVNEARDLALRVETKRRLVDDVAREAYFSGRSEAAVWREWQRHGGQPPPSSAADDEPGDAFQNAPPEPGADFGPDFDGGGEGFADFMRFFNGEIGADEYMRGHSERFFEKLGLPPLEQAPAPQEARAIYRRLVQQLHPDRGGEWTAARARLWDQVQQAWDSRDPDWLARLEVEWEAATDRLGPATPVSRLREALVEIDAARRDAERKLRHYRKDLAWRFSLQAARDALRLKMERLLRADCAMLREQIENLELTLHEWECAGRRRQRGKAGRGRNRPGQAELW